MSVSPFEKVGNMLNEIDEYCKNNTHLTYDELYDTVDEKVNEVEEFARANNVPVKIDTQSIVTRFKEEEEDEDDYEESSYYEEESEYYDDEYLGDE